MSDLRLDPSLLPDGLGISAEDWHQTPLSVQQQFLSLLKRVETLEAHVNRTPPTPVARLRPMPLREDANDGDALPSATSRVPNPAILGITRSCGNRPPRYRWFLQCVPVAMGGLRRSPSLTRIRS